MRALHEPVDQSQGLKTEDTRHQKLETRQTGVSIESAPDADFPRVVVRVQAPCARAHGSSMRMLMGLPCAQVGSECSISMLMEAPCARPGT